MNSYSYSQPCTMQDRYVLEKFIPFGCERRWFVEVGAHDGVRHSNTKLLEEQFGWQGLLIEPNPELFELCKTNRPGCAVSQIAVCGDVTKCNDQFFLGDSYGGLVDHMPGDWLAEHYRRGTPTCEVTSGPLDDVLCGWNPPSFIDYLSLDTEGSEFEILKSLTERNRFRRNRPFGRVWQFGVITVEFRYDKHLLESLEELLEEDYYLDRVQAFDAFFVNRRLEKLAARQSEAKAA